MKNWRKMIIFTLLLAMPISLWASATMSSHCLISEAPSHSDHAQMDDNQPMHIDDQETSQHASDQTNCECSENSNCSVTSCGTLALLNKTTVNSDYLIHLVCQRLQSFANLVDPDLLFRPPITNS